jgi:serine/threonine protein kinase
VGQESESATRLGSRQSCPTPAHVTARATGAQVSASRQWLTASALTAARRGPQTRRALGEFPQRFGKYLLLRRVAVGGMAEVLLAVERTEHAGLRFVTIKRIKPEYIQDADYIEFFLTEGRVSLQCAHPNLPQTYDLGVEDGSHYIAMEFLQGHTLLDIIRAAALKGKPLSVGTALRVAAGVAAALEHAHGLVDVDGAPLGVIHRDVTPQNIMVTAPGAVKLIDFGIVRAAVQTHQTQTGVVKGKFSYMAPEMLHGKPSMIDHRADLFALGIVLYETLTGRSLFRGRTEEETLQRVRTLEIPDLSQVRSDVPPSFGQLILRALERDPDHRFQSATEMLHALDDVAERGQIVAAVTRLRDEVLDRCGTPQPPSLDPEARVMLDLPVAPPRPSSAPPVAEPSARPRSPVAVAAVAAAPSAEEGSGVIPIDLDDAIWEARSEPSDVPERRREPAVAEGSGPGADLGEPAEHYFEGSPDQLTNYLGGPTEGVDGAFAERMRHLDRDPDLIYYLRRSGGLSPSPQTPTPSATHADRELSELLANLDR